MDVNHKFKVIPDQRFLITIDLCTIYLCWVIFISGLKGYNIAHKDLIHVVFTSVVHCQL